MSVYPEYLTSISGEWIEPYVWVFTLGDFEVYNRSDLPTGYEICVNINPSSPDYNTWFDYGDQKPHIIQDDGTTVRLRSNNVSNFFTFTKPTVASWIPVTNVDPATATEGDGYSAQLIYNGAQNLMHYHINASEFSTQFLGNRELFYRIRNATVLNGASNINVNHYEGTHTNGEFHPTVYGVYHFERVITNPLEIVSFVTASVTQGNLDVWNAAQASAAQAVADAAAAQAASDAQAALDAANNAANTPPNTPRSRRGNLNFW